MRLAVIRTSDPCKGIITNRLELYQSSLRP